MKLLFDFIYLFTIAHNNNPDLCLLLYPATSSPLSLSLSPPTLFLSCLGFRSCCVRAHMETYSVCFLLQRGVSVTVVHDTSDPLETYHIWIGPFSDSVDRLRFPRVHTTPIHYTLYTAYPYKTRCHPFSGQKCLLSILDHIRPFMTIVIKGFLMFRVSESFGVKPLTSCGK